MNLYKAFAEAGKGLLRCTRCNYQTMADRQIVQCPKCGSEMLRVKRR